MSRSEEHVQLLMVEEEACPQQQWRPWLILALMVPLGGVLTAALAYSNSAFWELTPTEWATAVATTAPLVAVELTLAIPACASYFRAYLEAKVRYPVLPFAVLVTVLFALTSLPLHRFNPLSTAYVFFFALCGVGALRDFVPAGRGSITYVDGIVWLLFFAFIDLRWMRQWMWYGVGFEGYDWWALAFTALMAASYTLFRRLDNFHYDLTPSLRDAALAIGGLLGFGVIIIPLGLLAGFLKWEPDFSDPLLILCTWIENVLTVAITEEVFFRGVLFGGLTTLIPRDAWYNWKGSAPLLLSSVAFGLMHWVRRTSTVDSLSYVLFATVAGLFFGTGYKMSGYRMFTNVLMHSLTDVTWSTLFG